MHRSNIFLFVTLTPSLLICTSCRMFSSSHQAEVLHDQEIEQTSSQHSNTYSSDILVTYPLSQGFVASPFVITGKAKGPWFSEGQFSVELLDDSSKLITTATIFAQGDSQTVDYVPFLSTITFTTSATHGTLVLHNDNPSGLPENDERILIPVNFSH